MLGGEALYGSDSVWESEYRWDSMETRRFTPSPNHIAKLAKDPGVKNHLRSGGLGSKAFIITGIKTAYNTTITTTEETGREAKAQLALDIPMTPVSVGPKLSYSSTSYGKHTRTMPKPIVFAIQVEKIKLSRKGKLVSSEYNNGAMLASDRALIDDFEIEPDGDGLDDTEADDLGVSRLQGLDDETGEDCSIIVPLDV